MSKKKNQAWGFGLIVAAVLLHAGLAAAAPGARQTFPSGRAQTELKLSMSAFDGQTTRGLEDYETVKVGDQVRVCFEGSRDGYITLWSHDAEGGVARILPNAYTEGGTAAPAIELPGGRKYCVAGNGLAPEGGDDGGNGRWWFEVREPLGLADIYLHWTSAAGEQLPDDSFVDIDALGRAVARSDPGDFATAWFSYKVVRE